MRSIGCSSGHRADVIRQPPLSIFFHACSYWSTLSLVTTSTPESMIGGGGHLAVLDVVEHLHRLAAPAEILLSEQHLHLAFAEQIERGLDRVERDHLGLRRIDRRRRVAREDRPAADRQPRAEIRIAVRAGGDELRAANRVLLDVVDLDDLDARRLATLRARRRAGRCRFVAPTLVMIAILPLPFSSFTACSPRMRPDAGRRRRRMPHASTSARPSPTSRPECPHRPRG